MNYKSPLRIAMEKAMNGEHVFERENPQFGETKRYFMKWGDDPFSTVSDAKIIDVPDDVDPEEFRLNGYQRPVQSIVEQPQQNSSRLDLIPTGYQSLLPENESLSSNRDSLNSSYPKYWETPEEGEDVYKKILSNEGHKKFKLQNMFEYIDSAKRAYDYIKKEKDVLSKNKNLTDKFKHAYLNCKGAQMGNGGSDMAAVLSYGKEFKDLITRQNKLRDSIADNYANLSGRLLGWNNPEADCEELLEKYIKKYY